MAAAAPVGQFDLAVPFRVARPVGVVAAAEAALAGYAFAVVGRRSVRCRQRTPAGTAQFRITFSQSMTHRHPFVEDEAFAFPKALVGGHLLQVSQDAAFQVENIGDAD